MYGNLLSIVTKITRDRGDLVRNVITSWNEDLLNVDHRTHNIWVVYFKTCPEEREFSRCRLRRVDAYDQQKKDLSDAEMDTLTKSCSLAIVITANGEVQTHEEAIVYVKELDIFLTMKVLENTPAVFIARKALRCKTDILINGSMVKNHISLKTGFGYNATRRTSFLLWFQACRIRLHQLQGHFQDRGVIAQYSLPARLRHLQ